MLPQCLNVLICAFRADLPSMACRQNLLAQPHCEPVEPGERHWDIFRGLCIEADVRGPRVTDAWLAALAIESGSRWITLDRDFARFPGLDWRVPAT
jgi:predicted nucleic acid-binding protein